MGSEQTRTTIKDLSQAHGNQWGKAGITYLAQGYKDNPPGRWPPNLVLTHSATCGDETCAEDCPVRVLGEQSGECKSGGYPPAGGMRSQLATYGKPTARGEQRFTASEGTASRFFPQFRYVAKASRRERNAGCSSLETKPVRRYGEQGQGTTPQQTPRHELHEGNHHPTVKPLALMSWLITLITPSGGTVLDCFAGSGTTLVAAKAGGWHYLGIEREAEYVQIAQARLAAVTNEPTPSRPAKKPTKRAHKRQEERIATIERLLREQTTASVRDAKTGRYVSRKKAE